MTPLVQDLQSFRVVAQNVRTMVNNMNLLDTQFGMEQMPARPYPALLGFKLYCHSANLGLGERRSRQAQHRQCRIATSHFIIMRTHLPPRRG